MLWTTAPQSVSKNITSSRVSMLGFASGMRGLCTMKMVEFQGSSEEGELRVIC
jgi:hypothetical protein